ncbi:MAG TPA: YlqD family protein [Caldisericia bacterium]|nr:YlqD family protein [Caldisericia bacterium]HPF48521.1 YlqD family protein [Caldisericia bacterium]HPI84609.1 YlqD family protein [Caldisericia bacterium]HPQ92976.1 YlqD family protein [Caldisericia bacterium]HRV75190.1 YlqD family protein [Caldisericia bacterium]
MQLTRKVILKAIVTEDFKRRFDAQIGSLISEIKIELDKIKSSEQQLMLKVGSLDYNQVMQVREQLEGEKHSRESTIKELETRLKQVKDMKEGDLFTQGTLDSIVDVEIGDNLDTKLARAEIVVKDGVVQSIKEG